VNEKTRSRSIHDVQRIVAHVGGGGGLNGFAIGAAPGAFFVGVSAVGWFAKDCGKSANLLCLGPGLGLFYGAIGALAGGIIGAVIREVRDQDRRVVYRRPVNRYLK
jgi:hypothetical protein